MKTVVIGAGVVGMASAWALREAGADVVVVDRAAGAGLETSFANGALLHPSLVEPWNSPGILKVLLGSLGREDAAVLLRLRALPGLVGWGLRFVRESSPARFEANALRNLRMAQYSLRQMAALRERTGIDYSYYRRGLLTLFRETAVRDHMLGWFRGLAAHGLEVESLDVGQTIAREPALEPIAPALVGSAYAQHDEAGDPHAFCVELGRWLAGQGVELRFGESVTRLVRSGGRITAIALASGEQLSADRFVLAAGSYSPLLARTAGLRLPIRPAKGYSLTVPRGDSGTAPWIPGGDTSLHVAVIPVGTDHLRIAGTAEFTGYDTTITQARADNLLRLLRQVYPRFADTLAGVELHPWTGLRPMCPDGVPVIGPTRLENLFLNTGHGHVGWTLAAGSGRLVADLVLGRSPEIAASDYDLRRFG